MVAGVKKLAGEWKYDAVSIGYPGLVVRNRLLAVPYNLGRGWAGFDFEAAFMCPVAQVAERREALLLAAAEGVAVALRAAFRILISRKTDPDVQ
jgi:hypothetical protein